MAIYALVTGTVSTAPTRRTTSKGSPWATLSIRVPSGEGSQFVNVAVFDSGLVDQVMVLAEGAAITVQGKLELRTWQGRDGNERQGLSVVASELLHLKVPPPKKRAPRAHQASQRTSEPHPFGEDASDLEDVLPRSGRAA